MKPKLLLRIAAVMMLMHAIGHTMGHMGWRKTNDPVKLEVIRQMTEPKFPFMGVVRSMGEYFEGFSNSATILLLLAFSLLWILSNISVNHPLVAANLLWPISIALLLLGIDELIYFFPFAAPFSIIASLLSFFVFLKLRKTV